MGWRQKIYTYNTKNGWIKKMDKCSMFNSFRQKSAADAMTVYFFSCVCMPVFVDVVAVARH